MAAELLLHQKYPLFKVYAVPGKAKKFAFSQSSKNRYLIEVSMRMALNRFQEFGQMAFIQRGNFLFCRSW